MSDDRSSKHSRGVFTYRPPLTPGHSFQASRRASVSGKGGFIYLPGASELRLRTTTRACARTCVCVRVRNSLMTCRGILSPHGQFTFRQEKGQWLGTTWTILCQNKMGGAACVSCLKRYPRSYFGIGAGGGDDDWGHPGAIG
jgi:hypothetical protein